MCGAGGIVLGFKQAMPNAEIICVDINLDCVKTVHFNLKNRDCLVIQADARYLPIRPTARFDLIAAGPPCKGFSVINTRRNTLPSAKKWRDLVFVFADIVTTFLPPMFMMENVEGMRSFPDYIEALRQRFEKWCYDVTVSVIDCADYGVPQYRRRMIWFGSIFGPIQPPPATNFGYCPKCATMAEVWYYTAEPGLIEVLYVCPKCRFIALTSRKLDCQPWQTIRERMLELRRTKFRARCGDDAWHRIIYNVNTSAEEEPVQGKQAQAPLEVPA